MHNLLSLPHIQLLSRISSHKKEIKGRTTERERKRDRKKSKERWPYSMRSSRCRVHAISATHSPPPPLCPHACLPLHHQLWRRRREGGERSRQREREELKRRVWWWESHAASRIPPETFGIPNGEMRAYQLSAKNLKKNSVCVRERERDWVRARVSEIVCVSERERLRGVFRCAFDVQRVMLTLWPPFAKE